MIEINTLALWHHGTMAPWLHTSVVDSLPDGFSKQMGLQAVATDSLDRPVDARLHRESDRHAPPAHPWF
jgi:hypothetical protein